MLKNLIIGALFLIALCSNAQTSSETNYPQWIRLPNGDLVLCFTKAQVDVIGEKLILKNYLVNQNYEITKENYLCRDRCDALAEALDLQKVEVAIVENENKKHAGREKYFNDRVSSLEDAISKEKKTNKILKIGIPTGIIAGLVGGFLIAK